MRKSMGQVLLLLSIVLLSSSAWANLSWINFANPYVEHLDGNQYRFRVDVNWGGGQWRADGWEYCEEHGPQYLFPELNELRLNLAISPDAKSYSAFNPTINHISSADWPGWSKPGDWYGGGFVPPWSPAGLTGTEFGWDFTYKGAPDAIFTFDYEALVDWSGNLCVMKAGSPDMRYFSYTESYSGSFSTGIIPEPTTILLIGLGLCGIGLIRKRW